MRTKHLFSHRKNLFLLALGLTLASGLSVPFTPVAEAATVASGAVELSPTPPNDTQAVAPNVMVTFDDSGSMAYDYMGDDRPYDNKSWNVSGSDPWRCAGVIDPRIDDDDDLRSHAMNGVYYNPTVLYSPPVNADGTSFPNADADLKKVWNDGVTANRPKDPSGSNSTKDFTGERTKNWLGYYTDSRWTCTGDSSSPLDNSGGPYYYRLKKNVDIGTVDSPKTSALYNSGNWEEVAVTDTDVTIDGKTVNQYQNWANWWAYYHTRNQMARSSISRVFGALGGETTDGGYGSTVRVAWQNLNDKTFKLPTKAIISQLMDTASCTDGDDASPSSTQQPSDIAKAPPCYRSAFFNWIFQTAASGGTPSVDAANRAGTFFTRGKTTDKKTLRNPYWEAGKIGPDGKQLAGAELYCRQNFHMLVTDGLWNENSVKNSSLTTSAANTVALPDGTSFVPGAAYNAIFGVKHADSSKASLSDVAFNYWATNLRTDLYKPDEGKFVPPYMPDKKTGVVTTGDMSAAGPNNTHVNNELFFNPKNDPANWPHLVQYMVGLGVSGELNYSDDTDCDSATSDACKLRKGTTGWPQPSDPSPGITANIDDTWHAAIASRGSFFSAGNPKTLVDQLSAILTNITARSAPAATGAVNTSVLVPGALGFSTGYDSGDWHGTFEAVGVNADGTTTTSSLWDAGSILDDADPDARKIFTGKELVGGGFNKGINFETFSDFDAAGQALLSDSPESSGDDDTGQARVDYLRGDRTDEGTLYRTRTTLLGAIINSQPVYVSYPSSGYRNSWPVGSPEQNAIDADGAGCAASSSCSSYEYFIKNHLTRTPTVYVGANDGMLHAFKAASEEDASGNIQPAADAGKELFAYVPRATYANLGNLTQENFSFLPTVDGIPVTRDVFFGAASSTPVSTTAGWHTLLVGGLRLGGRGVYALDITDPDTMSASKVLWEFSADQGDQGTWTDGSVSNPGGKPSDLGYTYGQPNIGRLNTGKWVVLVPGGYFPDCSKPPYNASNCSYPAAASNKFSSLFVLDAQTGKLIRELKTPDPATDSTAVASHGLSSPVLGDYNDDQIDDVAFAGDLDGNLWRYDLTSSDPDSWTVTLAYQPATAGAQPITSMPRLFGDPATNKFIVVFGTGKYLGVSDNTSDSGPVQAVYGIRDIGKTVVIADLVEQDLSEKQATDGSTLARGLTNRPVPADKGGWYFDLAPSDSSAGERVVVTPGALFDTGRAVIQTLIPGTTDPCSATIQGALMALNAATGGSDGGLTAPSVSGWGGTGAGDTSTVGGRVNNPRTGGSVPLVTSIGGGNTLVPGLKLSGSGDVLNINDAIWRRRSWRALNNDQ